MFRAMLIPEWAQMRGSAQKRQTAMTMAVPSIRGMALALSLGMHALLLGGLLLLGREAPSTKERVYRVTLAEFAPAAAPAVAEKPTPPNQRHPSWRQKRSAQKRAKQPCPGNRSRPRSPLFRPPNLFRPPRLRPPQPPRHFKPDQQGQPGQQGRSRALWGGSTPMPAMYLISAPALPGALNRNTPPEPDA